MFARDIRPLSGWTVHDYVDPQYLHGVQGIRYAHQRRESDQRERGYTGTQLEPHEIAYIMKYSLAFLDCCTTSKRCETDKSNMFRFIQIQKSRVKKTKKYLHNGFEIIIDQDHIGRFLADVGTVFAHSDAYVGLFQRDTVVHAVTGHADYIAVPL